MNISGLCASYFTNCFSSSLLILICSCHFLIDVKVSFVFVVSKIHALLKEVCILILIICKRVTFLHIFQIWLSYGSWGNSTGLSGWATVITKVIKRKMQVREGDMMTEAGSKWGHYWKRTVNQGCGVAFRSWKRQGKDSPLEAPGLKPSWQLDVSL